MSAKALGGREVWLVAGSQQLYGDEVIATVDAHAREVAGGLDDLAAIPVRVVAKPVVTSPDAIRRLCLEANADDSCVGIVVWMHTFSPARMWIGGLKRLQKPLLHLHTQFNRELPWPDIDMDFMNLNQSAHGDREFGHIATRLGLRRKTVVGHWREASVQKRIATWTRAACGWAEAQSLSVARFGDNMREVAVTEGDKVEAEIRFGFAANGYAVGDLVSALPDAGATPVAALLDEYDPAAYRRSPKSCGRAARGATRSCRRPGSSLRCERSSTAAAAPHSPTRSRICTVSSSYPASPHSDSWRTATGSVRRVTGRPRLSFAW